MRVVIAPDSLKGTVGAADAARALATGWASVRPSDELVLRPMADGGEGTLAAFDVAVAGAEWMPVTVTGPDDAPVDTAWLLLPDGTGVVELACTSGLTLLHPLRPLDAHTRGFGEAVAAALDHGVARLVLALGGSSSTDGGAGALTALGARFLDPRGRAVPAGNRGLAAVVAADLAGLRALPPGGVVVLSDVTNPLLGACGAASVFGPQKGAAPAEVRVLEANLARLAPLLPADADAAGAGAAGGTGFGLLAWGARIAPGAAVIADALGIPAAVAGASVVVTGEGRFDAQSAAGKAPSYLAALAADAGARAMLVAGAIEADTSAFAAACSLSELAGGARAARRDPLVWLEVAGRMLAAAADPTAAAARPAVGAPRTGRG